ncbi:E3 ubiquitin-protein ligase RING1-like [Sesamum indicum]|uniref:RING-type E3 ubiquitin transferase n=1 Tax=Sesamum indicum TaxID=4182 RepID=A0A6I9SM22_SESIN|nr:E3 ubiquitin-protein ligase RING1-like [Sesamum indicum]
MASETGSPEQSSFFQTLINSRIRHIALSLPYMLGLTTSDPLQGSTNPPQETQDQTTARESRDRIIFIDPFTGGMVVMESSGGSSLGLDSLLGDLEVGQRTASKASIDAMPSVEIVNGENDDEQCVVCLEEWETGDMAKEMPCKHKFHVECIEKWLKIRGSCPVCRYEMPADEDDDAGKRTSGENDGERRRRIWVSFSLSYDWRSAENNQTSASGSRENSDSASHHQETEA